MGVSLMANNHVLRCVLLASSVLLFAACASQPLSTSQSLDDLYFDREVQNYEAFQAKDGQIIYCQNEKHTASHIPYRMCISETNLRQLVEDSRRTRNTSSGTPIPAGAGQGMIGGG